MFRLLTLTRSKDACTSCSRRIHENVAQRRDGLMTSVFDDFHACIESRVDIGSSQKGADDNEHRQEL